MPGAYSGFDHLVAWLSLPAAFGDSAVILFLMISGVCVHFPYASNNRPLNIAQYSLRRAFRILPPYLFAVLLTCILEWFVYLIGGSTPTPMHRVIRVALLSQNYGAHAGQLLTNGSLWYLPIEAELYIVYLAFYFLLKSVNGWLTATIVLIVSLLAIIGYSYGIQELDGSCLRFWAIWCGGALLVEWSKRGSLPNFTIWNGLIFGVLLISATLAESLRWNLVLQQYLWAAAYFHVIWLVLLNPISIHKFPNWSVRLMVWMGTISYSAYLIHYPLFAVYGYLWRHCFGEKPADFLAPLFFSISIWPIAWLFWKCCEYPFHELSRHLFKRTPLTLIAGVKTIARPFRPFH